ncbi:lysophosphatidylserine lipase ABHD12-like isoform X2 [Sitophilus oryzae]|nr:lysophosphatidylserine lipase ABHD12-like isoform X2 [Sitophilus oryzae]XP_030755394.1 lysophosphatidylserine lipase ABHD12-like isoform X2 [Sitophilus oryzae]
MYITVPYPTSENITLGIWQVLPKEMVSDIVNNDEYNYDGIIANGKTHILIYLHGNGSDRTKSIELYKILREIFHIFAIDYRGYADSTLGELTENNIVSDIAYIYKWLRKRSKSKMFIWGHSLGSGVATLLASRLKKENLTSTGVVLETPFTSVTDVMKSNYIVQFYSFLPWFDATILKPIRDNGMDFNSKLYISDVDSPIMILHAKDDDIIPYSIATELYYTALNNRNSTFQGNVTYYLYEEHGYGHLFIYLVPHLLNHVKIFVDECLQFEQSISIKNRSVI